MMGRKYSVELDMASALNAAATATTTKQIKRGWWGSAVFWTSPDQTGSTETRQTYVSFSLLFNQWLAPRAKSQFKWYYNDFKRWRDDEGVHAWSFAWS